MSTKKEIAAGIIKFGHVIAKEVSKSESLQRQIFGTYSDGKPRNLADAISGEIHSPKERKQMEMRIADSAEKKKKKEKHGKRYAKINL